MSESATCTYQEGVIIEGTYEHPRQIDAVLGTCKKWLYVEEDYNITAPLADAIANFTKSDPCIYGIVGPSGSIKTEIIRALGEEENQYTYPISSITEKTLVSGYDESDDLIPRLKGRLLTIKDLTTILSKNKESSSQIFADFREMTDGYIKKEFGNGVTKEYHNITSSILFASTNAIEKYNAVYSNLGQRIIFQRPKNNRTEAMKRAQANTGKESQMRNEISRAVKEFLDDRIAMLELCGLPPIGDNGILYDSYEFLALARTTIEKDYRGEIEEIPEPEFPTRIAKTVSQLCQVHALIYDRQEVSPEDIAFGARIIKDNVPTQRWLTLSNMPLEWKPTGTIADLIRLPSATTLRVLDDLTALGLVERQHRDSDTFGSYRRSNLYRITKETYNTVHMLDGLEGVNPEGIGW